MFDEYNRLMHIYSVLGISYSNIWDFLVYAIVVFISLYLLKIYFTHLVIEHNRFLKVQALLISILIVAISYKYPQNIFNIESALLFIKSSRLIAFITGVIFSFAILASTVKFRSEYIGLIFFIIASILLIPSIAGVEYNSEISYLSLLGKCVGTLVGHNIVVYYNLK